MSFIHLLDQLTYKEISDLRKVKTSNGMRKYQNKTIIERIEKVKKKKSRMNA